MPLDPVTAALDIGGKLIDRLWPDPSQAAAAKLELFKLQQSGELQQITGQLDINKVEAASSSFWVAGARPAVMWTCCAALFYSTLIEPLARFVATVFYKYAGAFPVLDTALTMQILFALLGLGVYRTYEKVKGVAS